MNNGNKFGGYAIGTLQQGSEGIVVHRVISLSEVSEADVNWLVELPCFLHKDPPREQLLRTDSTLTKATLVLIEEEICTRLELI